MSAGIEQRRIDQLWAWAHGEPWAKDLWPGPVELRELLAAHDLKVERDIDDLEMTLEATTDY